MERLWDGMGILAERNTVWPDPRHLWAEGRKLYHTKILTESCSSLGLSYPRALQVVTPNADLIREITDRTTEGVLKREFSSQGKHVYTPHTKDAEAKLAHALRTERAAYHEGQTKFSKPAWFLQPYVAPLLFLGEVRVFIVNGTLFCSVMTTPKQADELGHMDIQEAMLFTPLSRLRYESPMQRAPASELQSLGLLRRTENQERCRSWLLHRSVRTKSKPMAFALSRTSR